MLAPWIAVTLLAAPANGVDEALARKLSPGGVALLLEHAGDSRVLDRISAAVKDTDATTRAMAARVVGTGNLQALVPLVAEALAVEGDGSAAREQARALLALEPKAPGLVLEAARRMGGVAAGDLGLALAAARGAGVLANVEALRSAGMPDLALAGFLEMAGRDEPSRLSAVGPSALRSRDAALWTALLGVARKIETEVPAGLLASALGDDDLFRARALEHLALTRPGGAGASADVLTQALDAVRGATPTERRPFALELVDRAQGRPPTDQAETLRAAGDDLLPFLQLAFTSRHLRGLLRPAELEVFRTRLGRREPPSEPLDPPKASTRRGTIVRLAAGYPRGFTTDLLAVSGCRPDDRALLGALLSRDKFGRPMDIGVYGELAGSPVCLAAAKAAMGTHLPPLGPAAPRGGSEVLLLPLEREGLDCRREAESIEVPAAPGKIGAKITEPRKIRKVAPDYPDSAKDERISGVVVLDAAISTTGCVCELEVVTAPDIRLAISALQAVAGWRYTPTLLGGTPVPMTMTVTVNFELRR